MSCRFRGLLHAGKRLELRRLLVERIQWIASRNDPVPRCRGAVAERAAQFLFLHPATAQKIQRQFGIRQHHPAKPDDVNPALTYHRLRDVREEFLQIGITATHQAKIGETFLQLADHRDVAHDANEGIFRRMIPVRRGVQGWPDHMRIVIGTRKRDVDKTHAEATQDLEQGFRLSQVILEWLIRVCPEAMTIRQRMLFRNSRTERAGDRLGWIWLERQRVYGAQPDPDFQSGRFGPDTLDDLFQETGTVFETPAIGARPGDRAQKLVTEVTMAMFQIDKVKAALLRAFGSNDVIFDQTLDIVIAHQRPVGGVTEFPVKDRMIVNNHRFKALVVVRLAEPARMSELQTDNQNAFVAHGLPVGFGNDVAKFRNVALRMLG